MKKLLSLMLCIVMLALSLAGTIGAAYNPDILDEDNLDVNQGMAKDETFTLGDVDCNGALNAVDFWKLKASLLGLGDHMESHEAADFDADGETSTKDAYYFRLCLSGASNPESFENGYQIYSLTIGGCDISEYSIIIEEDCAFDENEYMAAELLREYIPIACGVEIPIERGTGTKAHGIYIYDVDKESELGVSLGKEGYKYQVINGDLHIYGTDRGNMYAVYEILEDHLGFGFVENYFTFIYKQRTVDIPEGLSRTFVPGYRFRQSKSTFNPNEDYRTRFYLPRGLNGSVSFAYDKANIPASYYGNYVGAIYIDIHSMNWYYQMATGTMPDESFGTLEERYYQKLQSGEPKDETTWEPCATNNGEYELLFEGLLNYIDFATNGKNLPFLYEDGTHCFSFSPCDNTIWCTCRNCTKQARETSYVDIYLRLKNRGAEDIQEYFPGLKLYTLMYEKQAPVATVPSEHLIIVLGGNTCQNHPLGTDDVCSKDGLYKMSNREFEDFVHEMSALCKQSGAELWTWYYPETNNWWIYDIPNIYAIYYDVTWCYKNGITGFYYEGHDSCPGYMFEHLKAYMFSQVAFDPEMTIEEYTEIMKDYVYMTYGQGWEYIWEFLHMYEEAGDLAGYELGNTESHCFSGAYSRAFDCVSFEYIRDNYEYMRGLIVSAIDAFDPQKTPGGESRYDRLQRMLCSFELLGLGATYVSSYLNGDEESREIYTERYRWAYDYYYESGMRYIVYVKTGLDIPQTFNLDSNPFLQFTPGSMRPEITAALKGE